jgi:hypothetical protein
LGQPHQLSTIGTFFALYAQEFGTEFTQPLILKYICLYRTTSKSNE